ncbi:MAG: hypothetical protein D6771_05095 [Zetaproteobacteria bacterium]|nr:MAG: hypothetical protein D6771_05095 [Zetaproteobacteria bacterium]
MRRIWAGAGWRARVIWPSKPKWQWPEEPEAAYEGDAFVACALAEREPDIPAFLSYVSGSDEDGRADACALKPLDAGVGDVVSAEDLLRMAAAMRVRGLRSRDSEAAKAMAVEYGVLSEHTSCVLVRERPEEEKATELPALRRVPQMLAAGWGGMGSVIESRSMCPCLADPAPAFVGGSKRLRAKPAKPCGPMEAFMEALDRAYAEAPRRGALRLLTIRALAGLGLPKPFRRELARCVRDVERLGETTSAEEAVVASFLHWLAEKDRDRLLGRGVRQWIRARAKRVVRDDVRRRLWPTWREHWDAIWECIQRKGGWS